MARRTLHESLHDFLNDPINSLSRENIANHKLIFDVKLAAAESSYFLNVYLPDVDQCGCDLIFDDMHRVVQVQVKSIMTGGAALDWEIHKRLLRPKPQDIEPFGFESLHEGAPPGVSGGVIRVEISAVPEFSVKYYYTDIVILFGLYKEYIDVGINRIRHFLDNRIRKLQKNSGDKKVSVRKTCFLQAKNAKALLGLMGLHNANSDSCWRGELLALIKSSGDENKSIKEKKIQRVNDELANLSPSIRAYPDISEASGKS